MHVVDKERVFYREVGGETVVLNIHTGFYYLLDEISGTI